MSEPWLILADDLTGAADCAIPFAERGIASEVGWEGFPRHAPGRGVRSIDLGTRGLPAHEAAAAHAAAVNGLGGARIYKKIDSTLRGQPAAEIAAVLGALRERTGAAVGILAPAFPSAGRTTVGGRVLVGGRPVEESELWRTDHTYLSSDLVEILSGAGVRSRLVDLGTVRQGRASIERILAPMASGEGGVVVCDALNDDDLSLIARVAPPAEAAAFHCGSAGLARALAAIEPPGQALPRAEPRQEGSLFAVGSQAAVSRAAARALARMPSVMDVPIEPELLMEGEGLFGPIRKRVIDALAAGHDVLVQIHMKPRPNQWQGRMLAEGLARLLGPVSSRAGALMATGGETARALLSAMGVSGIALAAEVEPGFPLGVTLGAVSIPVATKAGAFGDEESLVRCAARFKRVQREGLVP
jgi:uncharacterized protein YgbK (DUF1537 family)